MPPSIGKTPSLSRALRTPRTFLRFRVTPMVQAMGTTSEHRKGTQSWYRLTCCYSKLVAFMVLDCRNYKFGACKACRAMFSKGRGSTWGTNDSHWLKRIIGSPIVAYNVQNIAEFAHERAMSSLLHVAELEESGKKRHLQPSRPAKSVKNIKGNIRLIIASLIRFSD